MDSNEMYSLSWTRLSSPGSNYNLEDIPGERKGSDWILNLTRKSSSSVEDERSSLSLVVLDVVEAVDASPATDGFLP